MARVNPFANIPNIPNLPHRHSAPWQGEGELSSPRSHGRRDAGQPVIGIVDVENQIAAQQQDQVLR